MAGRLSAASDLEGGRWDQKDRRLASPRTSSLLRVLPPELGVSICEDCVVEFRSRVSLHTERSAYRRWSSLWAIQFDSRTRLQF